MKRRDLLSLAVLGAAATTGVSAQSSDVGMSQITNGTSGLLILKNGDDDYSLKVVSGDGTKNVTFVRRRGPTAYADVSLVYQILNSVAQLIGLDV